MKIKSIVSAMALLGSASAMAHTYSGPLEIDQDSVTLLGGCNEDNTFIDFNKDGFDVVFLDLGAESEGSRVRNSCVIKFTAPAVRGYTLAISEFGVAGVSNISKADGETYATLRHTLAGTVGGAEEVSYQYDPADLVKSFEMNRYFASAQYLACGQGINFKSSLTLSAKGDGAAIFIDEAAQNGTLRYRYSWKRCP